MLLNNIMEKKLLGIFKRGSVFPLRTQKCMRNQNLELPQKTAIQQSKYSTNSWAGPLLLLTSLPIKSPFLLFDPLLSLYKLIPDYNLPRVSCIIPQKDFWFLMLRAAHEEKCLWLSSTKRVPASVVFWTLSPQPPQASAWDSRFLHSAAGTKDLKRFTEVPHPGITTKNMKWWGERKGDKKGWVRKRSARSWSQIKRQN